MYIIVRGNMRATELMIGDWVLINGTQRKIEAIDGVDGEIMADDELYTLAEDRYHSEDKAEGVPLTPEILENNEFEKFGDYYDIPNDPSLTIKAVSDTYIIGHLINGYFEGFISLDYVHELQHALRLCGIEKEIVP